ncbi:SseB family protein [Bacillus pacificus]
MASYGANSGKENRRSTCCSRDDKQKQKEFYELLLSTEFYVAGSLEAEEGQQKEYFACVISKERVAWIVPFFTQMEFVKDVLPEGTPLITIRGKELF